MDGGACSAWGHTELDTTEWLHFYFSLSCFGEGNGNPLQCSCLENPRDRGAWWAAVYGVAQSQTRLKRLSSSSLVLTGELIKSNSWPSSTHFEVPYYTLSGEGKGAPLQYSCLESTMDGGAWKAAVHWVAEGRTLLSDFTLTFHFHALEKEMATHSSVLAWRIPGMGEPGGLLSMGLHRVGHDWSDLAAAALYIIIENHVFNLFYCLKFQFSFSFVVDSCT